MIKDARENRTWEMLQEDTPTRTITMSAAIEETRSDVIESINSIMNSLRMAQCGHISDEIDAALTDLRSTNASINAFIELRQKALFQLIHVEP